MIASTETIRERLGAVREQVAAAAARAGRSADDVTVIGVTKGFPATLIDAARQAGLAHLGENRIQEARDKIDPASTTGVTWHMIGHLQSNKARFAARLFDWVHTVDSLHLAEALDARREPARPLDVLLQVKMSAETTKTGLAPGELADVAGAVGQLSHLRVRGLMTVAPLDPDPAVAHRAFVGLRELAGELDRQRLTGVTMEHLSMGMSGDFEIAVEEGATMIRLGTSLFGPRPARA